MNDLTLYCSRKELELYSRWGKNILVCVVKFVCDWLKRLKFSNGYVSNIGSCVNIAKCTITWLKSHDCHILMQRVVIFAFYDLIPFGLWNSLTKLSQFFKDISTLIIIVNDMIQLGDYILVIMCKLENIFLPSFSIQWSNSLYNCPIRTFCVDPCSLGGCIHSKYFETLNKNGKIRPTQSGQFVWPI